MIDNTEFLVTNVKEYWETVAEGIKRLHTQYALISATQVGLLCEAIENAKAQQIREIIHK